MPVTILIVDDYPTFREFLKSFILQIPDVCIAGQASDGDEAVQLAARLCPDLVIMDIEMPGMGGFEATRCIKRQNPDTRVMLLSALDDEAHSRGAADCGADAFLRKDGEIMAAIVQLVRQSPQDQKAG